MHRPSSRSVTEVLRTRWIYAAVALAVLVRLAVLWIVIHHPDRAMTPDSPLYLDLGRHFHEAYVLAETEHLGGSVLRTPGYPLFCYALFTVFGDGMTPILVTQNILSLVSVAIVFVLALQLAGPAAAGWAALVAVMDPLSITYSNQIRNEVLFTAVVALSVLQWHRSLRRPSAVSVVTTGLLFAVATLVRPVTTYLILFLVPADIWLRYRGAGRAAMTVWLVVGFLVPLGGWAARNSSLTGAAVISSVESENLLYQRAAGAIAEETRQTRVIVAERLRVETGTPPVGAVTAGETFKSDEALALRLLLQHPYGALMSTMRGMGRLLVGPGTTSFTEVTTGGRANGFVVRWLLAGYLAIMYLGVTIGVVGLVGRRLREPLVVVGVVLVYLVLISSGPEAYSRFRAPVMPLFAVLAGIGLANRSRREPRTPLDARR